MFMTAAFLDLLGVLVLFWNRQKKSGSTNCTLYDGWGHPPPLLKTLHNPPLHNWRTIGCLFALE
jgi:hypothetical protein